eukprot:807236-Rhodomonas_salina.2
MDERAQELEVQSGNTRAEGAKQVSSAMAHEKNPTLQSLALASGWRACDGGEDENGTAGCGGVP